MVFDLAIIGGGPAGCAAAIGGARHGASVLLLERGHFPRHKVCGEFVSAESLGLLATLLPNDFPRLVGDAPRISQTRIFLDNAILRAKIDPPAASITRFDLDSALWSAAAAAGVTAQSDITVRAIEEHGSFRILCPNEVFVARSVINAAGRWSNLTSDEKRAGASGEKWLGIKAHFYEACASDSVDLYFFDGGYCGVQPISVANTTTGSGTRINACAMVRADTASTLSEVLLQHPLLSERSRAWFPASDPVSVAPLIFHEPEPVQNGMLQVGDAAMFVDPFIGDGISLALRSGALAAECLARFFRKETSLEGARANYSYEYHQRFAHILNTSSRLRGLLRWPRAFRKPVLSVLAKAPLLASQIVRMTR